MSVSPTWPPAPGPPSLPPAGPRQRCRCVCPCSDGAGQWSPGGDTGCRGCSQQSHLELGTFSKSSFRVPWSFFWLYANILSAKVQRAGICVAQRCCQSCQGCSDTHDLHFAGGPAAVGGGEDGGTALTVAGSLSIPQHAAHRHRVDAVGVPVAVAVVVVGAAVARGPDEDGAEPAPSLESTEG